MKPVYQEKTTDLPQITDKSIKYQNEMENINMALLIH
jgi:hypothetical protein